jgi:hypothetical protein
VSASLFGRKDGEALVGAWSLDFVYLELYDQYEMNNEMFLKRNSEVINGSNLLDC